MMERIYYTLRGVGFGYTLTSGVVNTASSLLMMRDEMNDEQE